MYAIPAMVTLINYVDGATYLIISEHVHHNFHHMYIMIYI